MRVLILVLVMGGLLGGCLSRKYTQRKDGFTGEVVSTAPIGKGSSGTVGVNLYAEAAGGTPYVVAHIVNSGEQWVSRIDFLVSSGRFSISCGVGQRSMAAFGMTIKSNCALTVIQARQLAASAHIKWRANGVVGVSSASDLRNAARVFGGLTRANPSIKPPVFRRKPKKREPALVLPDPPPVRDDD